MSIPTPDPSAPHAGPSIRDQFAAYIEQRAAELGTDPAPNEYERQRRIAQQFADHFNNPLN